MPKGQVRPQWQAVMEIIIATLQAHNIDISRFGQGKAKSLAHLFAEIDSGEAELFSRAGRLVRRLAVLNVDVHATWLGTSLRLVEDRQEFVDGRVRRRDLPCTVSEKLHRAEDRSAGVVRALAEELGIRRCTIISPSQETVVAAESPSFPGLWSEYVTHRVAVMIDPAVYRQRIGRISPINPRSSSGSRGAPESGGLPTTETSGAGHRPDRHPPRPSLWALTTNSRRCRRRAWSPPFMIDPECLLPVRFAICRGGKVAVPRGVLRVGRHQHDTVLQAVIEFLGGEGGVAGRVGGLRRAHQPQDAVGLHPHAHRHGVVIPQFLPAVLP